MTTNAYLRAKRGLPTRERDLLRQQAEECLQKRDARGIPRSRPVGRKSSIPAQWIQPTGAQDAYEKDDVISRDAPDRLENVWRSKIQANTAAPGEDGTPPDGPWLDRYWEPISGAEWRQLQRGGAV